MEGIHSILYSIHIRFTLPSKNTPQSGVLVRVVVVVFECRRDRELCNTATQLQVQLLLQERNGFALEKETWREKMRNGGGAQLGKHDDIHSIWGETIKGDHPLLAPTAA